MIAISAGALTASVTTLVIFPLGAMALAIFATGALLNYTDQRWKIKDRKSTRLNSSHLVISYAVFCLKKKKRIRVEHWAHELHGRQGDGLVLAVLPPPYG